jgi:hypothetical protein
MRERRVFVRSAVLDEHRVSYRVLFGRLLRCAMRLPR